MTWQAIQAVNGYYDKVPLELRTQIIHIWIDSLGDFAKRLPYAEEEFWWWSYIHKGFVREKGRFFLANKNYSPHYDIYTYFGDCSDGDAFDLIELTFKMIDLAVRELSDYKRKLLQLEEPDDAIGELNQRFLNHSVGYEFAGGELIRVDSKLIHAEVFTPALQLLSGGGTLFSGSLQEFLDAYRKFREGEYKDAIADASKAYESVLKSICEFNQWPFDPHKDTANKLLKVVIDHRLIPEYLQNQFIHLHGVLGSVRKPVISRSIEDIAR